MAMAHYQTRLKPKPDKKSRLSWILVQWHEEITCNKDRVCDLSLFQCRLKSPIYAQVSLVMEVRVDTNLSVKLLDSNCAILK